MKLFDLILPFFLFILINCESCRSGLNITDSECFNEITYLDFENKHYRAGHFAMNSKGDLILEYSYNQYRLFLGFKSNGKFYFPEMTKEIELKSNKINSSFIRRYESINSFISFMDDSIKQKEFLLSISSYITILELYDFEDGNDSYKITESVNFFNNSLGIFSYVFQILEAKINDNNIYFCIYVIYKNRPYMYIKKLGFSNFNLEEVRININDVLDNHGSDGRRIISSIIIDYYNLIAIFYLYENQNSYSYASSLYNYELEKKGGQNNIETLDTLSVSDGIFFKAIYLYNEYIAFLHFIQDYYIQLKILYLNLNSFIFSVKINYLAHNRYFFPVATMNEFLKIDNKRFVFITFLKDSLHSSPLYYDNIYQKLFIIFFDIYGDYEYIKTRYYHYNFQSPKISKFFYEISAFIFNGFLAFTGAVLPQNINTERNNVFSLFIMFSYPNGTDFETDIFPYLIDTGSYDSSYNLYNYLMTLMKIDNNILGYEKVEQIRLVSIPDEIIFLNGTDNSIISNNNSIDVNYLLKQNVNIIKENKYYYLDYQFMVKEPDYDIFYSNTYGEIEGDIRNLSEYFTPKILYGRTDNDQKCESCLEEYSFNNNENVKSECVGEGYFFDTEINAITACTTDNSKFYMNITNNKRICFKDDYDCPNGYQDYNETSKECKFLKKLNEEINQMIDDDLLKNFTDKDDSIEIKGENNSIFQLTTSDNELNRYSGKLLNENNLSIIDLGACGTTLKSLYHIDPNLSLIIKKFEKITISAERNVQYEVYHPLTKEKLNLSLCNSNTIDLYIPITLEQKILDLYDDLQNSGYDLFDINDPFYNDLCSPYKSENGTDVLLSDRKNDYYNNNYTTCQSNCEYSQFISEYKFLKCECKIVVDDINIHDFNKFSKKISKNFYDILQNSNYKTLKCYNLVFNKNYFVKNIGNFIVLGLFVCYLCFFIIFIIKGISPLKEDILHSINNESEINNNKNEIKKIVEFPPKKKKIAMVESVLNLKDSNKYKRKIPKYKKPKNINENKTDSVNKGQSSTNDKNNLIFESRIIFENNSKPKRKKKRKSKKKINKKIKNENVIVTNKEVNKDENKEKFDDLYLNNLTYEKALESDKRTFTQIYFNRLKSKHLLFYTFFSFNDHNLIYIKISRFFFMICTSMVMNVFFFFDSSMHKIYIDYGKYNFIAQMPQILYSSIIALVIEILIGILSYTDKDYLKISQSNEHTEEKINKVLKVTKIRLIIYFIITFILFLFYWYFISSFCAVYNNTQIIFIKDFITSFCLGLLYPFAIQLCFALLRKFTLKKNTKFRKLLYKLC